MINLLPIESQKEIKSRRINLILLKYLIVLSASAAFLIAASLSTNIFLNIAKNSVNQSSTDVNNESNPSASVETKIQNTNILLSQQKYYSKFLLDLSNAIPEGAILKSIKIDKTSIDSSVSAEFILNKNVTIEKLKNDLENSDLVISAVLNQSEDKSSNSVSALLNVNSEALK